ncbi:SubName: Full=Uncharacterized protein {ECO:0000313/EMBL:CCA75833.1} [Serendipita indica DSM 11827]|nr:SubName: Full=Uncharacterized protein {ECO:0000313/EMBL:CCA75833.1} [Serendipita indica DSM 11827]
MALAIAVYSLSTRAAQDVASNTTESASSCANQYRSLPGIVWSCLTTIFLCIWVSLHLNVPEPVDTRSLNSFNKLKFEIRYFIRRNLIPLVVTLMAPEWVLGVAIRQFVMAAHVAKEIGATRQQGFFIIMGGFHLFKRTQGSSFRQMREWGREEAHPLVEDSVVEEGEGRLGHTPSGEATNTIEEEVGEPVHPLDEFDVCRLIKAGKLRLPHFAELKDKCKSDGLAKFLVILQTLWFITQCIARKANKLSLTELEVVTLGYTLLTLSMYVAWWDKPYGVTFPVRVYETLPERTIEQEDLKKKKEEVKLPERVYAYISGTQGYFTDLRSQKRVPMFHSGRNGGRVILRDFIGPMTIGLVGTLFGAVHLLAWSSPFPSGRVQWLWRFGAVVMTVAPPAAFIGLIFLMLVQKWLILAYLIGYLLRLVPICYLVGRGITIVLAFLTLATLPLDAYQDVEWSDFFPHI